MSNIIQFTRVNNEQSKSSIYIQAMQRRSEKNGIDYKKLYNGTDEEKAIEKAIREKNYQRQSLEAWTVEG